MALAADLSCALDAACLAERAGLTPDDWQAQLLRSSASRVLLNCSRQSGKSSVTALLALHTALYRAPALILLLSPGERQSGELFRKVVTFYNLLGRPVRAQSQGALHLELENGSRLIALPGQEETVRSFSGVALLCVDEASRVLDSLYFAVRPMLAVSDGRLVVLSTPQGKRGFFHQEWIDGQDWERYRVPAACCPRISPQFLAEERRALPPYWFSQEYLCEFGETSDQLFSHADVMAAITPAVTPLFAA